MTQLTINYDILIDVAVFKDRNALCMCMYVCTMLLTGQVHVERHLFTMLHTQNMYKAWKGARVNNSLATVWLGSWN